MTDTATTYTDDTEFKIQGNVVRAFRIDNKFTKSGKLRAKPTVYTVVYTYDPALGRVRYGACKFEKSENQKFFSKKAHTITATDRYTKFPVYFDMYFDGDVPSQVLHEVRNCIKRMIFTIGMKCRHPTDLAYITGPLEHEIKYKLKNGATYKRMVTLVPQNAYIVTPRTLADLTL